MSLKSLRIDVGLVTEVLIAGRWYDVHQRTFWIGLLDFLDDADGLTVGRDDVGFSFASYNDDGKVCEIAGPYSSVQAVRLAR
jgi:hypothetical protein